MAITKQRIPKEVLPRRNGLGRILEFVMPFQNAIPYTQIPKKGFFNLVRGITRSRNIYRAMARMQTNQMKATPAICYVRATRG